MRKRNGIGRCVGRNNSTSARALANNTIVGNARAIAAFVFDRRMRKHNAAIARTRELHGMILKSALVAKSQFNCKCLSSTEECESTMQHVTEEEQTQNSSRRLATNARLGQHGTEASSSVNFCLTELRAVARRRQREEVIEVATATSTQDIRGHGAVREFERVERRPDNTLVVNARATELRAAARTRQRRGMILNS